MLIADLTIRGAWIEKSIGKFREEFPGVEPAALHHAARQTRDSVLGEPEPEIVDLLHYEREDGWRLLDEIEAFFRRFLVLPSPEAFTALVLASALDLPVMLCTAPAAPMPSMAAAHAIAGRAIGDGIAPVGWHWPCSSWKRNR